MNKRYTLNMSDGNTEVEYVEFDEEKKVDVKKIENEFEIEKIMLSTLFNIASRKKDTAADLFICVDNARRVENLSPGEIFVYDESDKKLIDLAIKEMKGKMPFLWLKCVSLWKQLANPEEKKD